MIIDTRTITRFRPWKLATALLIFFMGVGSLVSSCGDNEDRGTGDSPVGDSDDTPAQVVNFPDTFMNVAFKCMGVNGIYAHTRVGSPTIIPNDPMCATGGG